MIEKLGFDSVVNPLSPTLSKVVTTVYDGEGVVSLRCA